MRSRLCDIVPMEVIMGRGGFELVMCIKWRENQRDPDGCGNGDILKNGSGFPCLRRGAGQPS